MADGDVVETGEETETEDEKVEISASELEALKADKAAADARAQAAEVERARLEGQASQTPAPAAPAKAPPTRAQLQAAVDDGTISQSEKDTEMARQDRETVKAEVKAELTQEFDARDQARTIDTQHAAYMKLRPEIATPGSESRLRVTDEFNALVEMGLPKDAKATELAAMRAAFGSLDRIEETTRSRRPAHEETGGAGGHDDSGSDTGWRKGLTQSQIDVNEHQIKSQAYSGDDDPMLLRVATRQRTGNKDARKSA